MGIFKRKDTENLRLQRIMAKIENYHFKVEYVRGKENFIADALSRYPVKEPTEEDLAVMCGIEINITDPLIIEVVNSIDKPYKRIVKAISERTKFGSLPKIILGKVTKEFGVVYR